MSAKIPATCSGSSPVLKPRTTLSIVADIVITCGSSPWCSVTVSVTGSTVISAGYLLRGPFGCDGFRDLANGPEHVRRVFFYRFGKSHLPAGVRVPVTTQRAGLSQKLLGCMPGSGFLLRQGYGGQAESGSGSGSGKAGR